ncbi:MAG: hypothetical protein U9Q98_03995, partial [Bacteroidota bacterium]|nr:hypothetical protein [Bacteroidota bacterium]
MHAQSGVCDSVVPYFEADLSADPNMTWESPSVIRQGYCCGNGGVDRCIEFSITLHPDAVAVIFDIASGAVPGGSMFYQINCGPPVEVGEPVCLTGVGPHTLTFCKPGNNDNTYSIVSVPEPSFTGLDVATENCYSQITVEGAIDGTVTYEDLTGGGTYLSYLSCTDCSDPLVIPDDSFPEYVDYRVCGDAEAAICMDYLTYCDTVRIYFYDTINAAVSPDPSEYCDYEGGLLLHADIFSGVPPYNFEWYDDHDSTGNIVGTNQDYFAPSPGPYSVVIYDSLYPQCEPLALNLDVIEHPQPNVSVDPANPFICMGDSVTLTASGANTYIWSPAEGLSQTTGETVIASPDSTTTYTVVGTDTNGCTNEDTIQLTVNPVPTVYLGPDQVHCDYDVPVTIDAGAGFNYNWSTGATSQTIDIATTDN